MLVIVSVPKLPLIVCPTDVTSTPPIVTFPGSSVIEIAIDPLVVADPLSGSDPVAKPASDTTSPSSEPFGTRTDTPLSPIMIVSVVVAVSP
jgi:hypothetical protein